LIAYRLALQQEQLWASQAQWLAEVQEEVEQQDATSAEWQAAADRQQSLAAAGISRLTAAKMALEQQRDAALQQQRAAAQQQQQEREWQQQQQEWQQQQAAELAAWQEQQQTGTGFPSHHTKENRQGHVFRRCKDLDYILYII